MLAESLSVGREFAKFMIGACVSSVPVYVGLVKLVMPDNYSLDLETGVWLSIPAVMYLAAGVIFVLAYFPQQGSFSLDLPDQIESERLKTLKRRRRLSAIGLSVYILAIVIGLWKIGVLLIQYTPRAVC
jgi:hypothetical protein